MMTKQQQIKRAARIGRKRMLRRKYTHWLKMQAKHDGKYFRGVLSKYLESKPHTTVSSPKWEASGVSKTSIKERVTSFFKRKPTV